MCCMVETTKRALLYACVVAATTMTMLCVSARWREQASERVYDGGAFRHALETRTNAQVSPLGDRRCFTQAVHALDAIAAC